MCVCVCVDVCVGVCGVIVVVGSWLTGWCWIWNGIRRWLEWASNGLVGVGMYVAAARCKLQKTEEGDFFQMQVLFF